MEQQETALNQTSGDHWIKVTYFMSKLTYEISEDAEKE